MLTASLRLIRSGHTAPYRASLLSKDVARVGGHWPSNDENDEMTEHWSATWRSDDKGFALDNRKLTTKLLRLLQAIASH